MTIKTALRHVLRVLGQRLPQLRRFSGKIGLGRLVAPDTTLEHIYVDTDLVIELDLSVPTFRYLYFHHDLSSALETILVNFFRAHGYEGFQINEHATRRGNVTVRPLDLTQLNETEASNVLFVPTRRKLDVLSRFTD